MNVPLHNYWGDMSPLSHRDQRPWVCDNRWKFNQVSAYPLVCSCCVQIWVLCDQVTLRSTSNRPSRCVRVSREIHRWTFVDFRTRVTSPDGTDGRTDERTNAVRNEVNESARRNNCSGTATPPTPSTIFLTSIEVDGWLTDRRRTKDPFTSPRPNRP